MKKVMFAMAAVAACAIQAQAALWTATIDFGTDSDYIGYSVWAVNVWNKDRPSYYPSETAPSTGVNGVNYADALDGAATPEAQIAILNNTVNADYNVITSPQHYPGAKDLTVGNDGKVTIASDSSNEQYSWLFILKSDATATYGTEYAVIQAHESTDVVEYTGGDISKAKYTVGNYTISGDKITVATSGIVAAPEPTSGLLLLLGVAGLALKRRRA